MDPQDETQEASLIGRTIGSYRIERLLGRGGMGEVFRAQDRRLKRTVAVKSLRGERADNEIARQRFVREARLATRVAHPYIATVFDVVDDQGVLLLVMEYIRGDTLHRRLKDGDVDAGTATRWGLEIAEALQAVHEAGIVHRDLKPGNVMLAPNGHVKITDFGVARITAPPVADDSVSPTWTESPGDFVTPGGGSGTVQYMSPEQVRGDRIDARSDLFSLGVVLWETITGEHPFRRQTRFETASAILSEEPGGGEVPEALEAQPGLRNVVLRLTRKDPDERYATAAEVVAALQALAHPEEAEPVSFGERARRHPVASVAAVLVVLVAAWAVYEWTQRGRGGPAHVPDVRPVIAVLPFDDALAPAGAEFEAEMVAALLAAELSGTRSVRALGTTRVDDILDGLGAGARLDARIDAIRSAAEVDWILAGDMYRDGGSYRASAELYTAGHETPVQSIRADASQASGLVDGIVAALRGSFGSDGVGGEDTRLRVASDSDEANLLEYRGRRALREYRLAEAIDLFERALRVDPDLISAEIALVDALDRAGYGAQAINVAEKVAIDAADDELGVPPLIRHQAMATASMIRGEFETEIEHRIAIVDVHGDDPGLLFDLASAYGRSHMRDDQRTTLGRAIAIDASDPRLHVSLAVALVQDGDVAGAKASLERGRALFEAIGSGPGLAEVDSAEGRARRAIGDSRGAQAAYERARDRYVNADLPVLASIAQANRGDAMMYQGEYAAAEAAYRDALPVARTAGLARLAIQTLGNLGAVYHLQVDLDQAEAYYREAIAMARQYSAPELKSEPLLNLASLLVYEGRIDESVPVLQEGMEAAQVAGLREDEAFAGILLADSHLKRGEVAEAETTYDRVVRRESADGGNPELLAWALTGISEVQSSRGSLGTALDSADRAASVVESLQDPVVRGAARVRLAWALTDVGDAAAAMEELDAIDAEFAELDSPPEDAAARAAVVRGIARSLAGDAGAVAALEIAARDSLDAPEVGSAAFSAASRQAMLDGDAPRAMQLAHEALAVTHLPVPQRVEARNCLAMALAAAGDAPAAADSARAALEEATRIGLSLEIARASGVLAGAGATVPGIDVDAARSRAAEAIESLESSIPKHRRSSFRSRPDIQWLGRILAAAGA